MGVHADRDAALCTLSKQPQVIFVLLELMVSRLKGSRWSSLAIVVLPGLILSPLWAVAVSADIAVWGLLEKRNVSSEHCLPTKASQTPSGPLVDTRDQARRFPSFRSQGGPTGAALQPAGQ
jgi:hypothetical protein